MYIIDVKQYHLEQSQNRLHHEFNDISNMALLLSKNKIKKVWACQIVREMLLLEMAISQMDSREED